MYAWAAFTRKSFGMLANYTNEQSTDLLVKALFGSKTSSTLQSANQVQVGVKSASALNILASTVFFQADGCGYNPSGTTTTTAHAHVSHVVNITVVAITTIVNAMTIFLVESTC